MGGTTHWIRDPDAIACLGSPVRQRLLDRLEALGPATAAELAESLGLPPDRVYYHLRLLEKHDLIREVGHEGEGRRRQALYDLRARSWHIAYDPTDEASVEAVDRLTAAMLRQGLRDFEGGWEHPRVEVGGRRRNQWSLRLEAQLSPSEVERLNEHLEAIVQLLRKPDRSSAAAGDATSTHVALTWLLSPLVEARSDGDEVDDSTAAPARK